jgi:hypothetical protein
MAARPVFESILNHQKYWAKDRFSFEEVGGDTCYTRDFEDNLFHRPGQSKALSLWSFNEFNAGEGHELVNHMRALTSSSALLVNVFEYWRQTGRIVEIAEACGSRGMSQMEFEKKCAVFRGGKPPHIDLVFEGSARPLAIEAKFTEPYYCKSTQRNKTNLASYLKHDEIWEGLSELKKLATEIREKEHQETDWHHLDTPQLIKHILGLTKKFKGPKGFTLLYLWYDTETPESTNHRKEIRDFSDRIKYEIHFRNMTYQRLFNEIQRIPNVDESYINYLRERYFADN